MANTGGIILLLAGVGLFFLGKSGQTDTPAPPPPPPAPEPTPPPLPTAPVEVITDDGLVITYEPYHPAQTPNQQVWQWDWSGDPAYQAVKAINENEANYPLIYRTGWALLGDGNVYGGQPSLYQMYLYRQGWTPEILYSLGKDAITVFGQSIDRQITGIPNLSNVNWDDLPLDTNYLAIRNFLTGFMFLDAAGKDAFRQHLAPANFDQQMNSMVTAMLTVPSVYALQEIWAQSDTGSFVNFPS